MFRNKRNILVVTGSRAEYGLIKPVLRELKAHPLVTLRLVVTGMHLSSPHGKTVRLIQKDGFKVDFCLKMHPETSTTWGIAESVGRGILGFAQVFKLYRPDIILVLGDRTEVFAAVGAATYMNIFIAHIHGGDRSQAGADEAVRHAITKLAHFHFPATLQSAERIQRLGERKKSIFLTGSPAVDDIRRVCYFTRRELIKKLKMPQEAQERFFILIQHPVSTQCALAGKQMREVLNALAEFQTSTVCILPNNDAGSKAIVKEIMMFAKQNHWLKLFRNLERRTYLSILKHACIMIGNSSSGIIDTGYFGIPVINVGIRQAGRERACNVIDVPPKKKDIVHALRKALNDKTFLKQGRVCKNIYGDGRAGKRIASVLARVSLSPALLQKQIIY